MGKLFLVVIVAVAVILGVIAFATQGKQNPQPTNSNLSFPGTSPTETLSQPQSSDSTQGKQLPSITLAPKDSTPIGPLPATMSATIKTSQGDITLTLFRSDAPGTVANFVNKAKSGFYKNLIFHRVEDWVIQGGDPAGTGTGGSDMPTELNQKSFITGSLGVAGHQGADGKIINNDAQFFITKSDATWLNGQYTNFGIVTSGIDVVNKIKIGDKILAVTIQ